MAAPCVIVKVCPAIVKLPLLVTPVALPDQEYVTVPVRAPVALAIWSHGTLLDAAHVSHVEVTEMVRPEPAVEGIVSAMAPRVELHPDWEISAVAPPIAR